MSKSNITQLSRYKIIDKCFQNKFHKPSTSDNPEDYGKWPIRDLIEVIREEYGAEFCERTIKDDLKRMKSSYDLGFLAPIKNKKGVGYYYDNPNYKLTNNPLGPSSIKALEEIIELLQQFKGFKYFEDADELIINIEEKVKRSKTNNVQFDILSDYRGLDFITPLKNAIYNKTVVKIGYKAFYDEVAEFKHIHPYLLKEYNNRWFVYAYTNEYDSEGVYGLDRIKSLEPVDMKFRNANKNRIINYFKDIIGVTNPKDTKAQNIILKFKINRANYLITKPIHKSQKIIKQNEDFVWFSFYLKPNKELSALILNFGDDVVVEEPYSLATEIKNILQQAVSNYE